jgi:hypothetical protein
MIMIRFSLLWIFPALGLVLFLFLVPFLCLSEELLGLSHGPALYLFFP